MHAFYPKRYSGRELAMTKINTSGGDIPEHAVNTDIYTDYMYWYQPIYQLVETICFQLQAIQKQIKLNFGFLTVFYLLILNTKVA